MKRSGTSDGKSRNVSEKRSLAIIDAKACLDPIPLRLARRVFEGGVILKSPKETTMRLSLTTALGIAAFLGIVAVDTPDANALARRTTIVSSPRGAAAITRRPGRVAVVKRGSRRMAFVGGWRGARGAAICRTTIVNGVRVTRCR